MRYAFPPWVIGFAILVATLTSIPVIAGYLHSDSTTLFSGFDFQEDSRAYAAYVESGVSGNPFLLLDKSTSEPQEPRYIIVYFTILALITRLTGIAIDIVWNVARFVVMILLLLKFWTLFSRTIANERVRNMAFILLGLGGGLGWIVPTIGKFIPAIGNLYSTDLSYPIGYTFFAFSFHALSLFGMLFVVGMIHFLLDYWETKKPRAMALASFCALLAFFNHPAAGVVAWIVLGLVLLYKTFSHGIRVSPFSKDTLRAWLGPIVGGGLIVLYTLWARSDAVYAFHQSYYLEWAKHEPLVGYVLGMGLPLLFGLGTLLFLRNKNAYHLGAREVFGAWLVVALGLSFILPAGVKYLYLAWPPLAFFGAHGIHAFSNYLSTRISAFRITPAHWSVLFVLVACLTAPFLVEARTSETLGADYFHSSDTEAGLRFLATQTKGIVLADFQVGSLISWRTPHLPYVAHGFLTIDFKEKRAALAEWLGGSLSREEELQFLKENRITYVWIGPTERALGNVNSMLPLTPIFENETVSIFRVDPLN